MATTMSAWASSISSAKRRNARSRAVPSSRRATSAASSAAMAAGGSSPPSPRAVARMAVSMPLSYYNLPRRRPTHRRRNATSIMAGDFDPRPERDVLTSRLSNIPPYLEVEKKTEEDRLKRKLEKRLKEREKKRKSREELKAAAAKRLAQGVGEVTTHREMSCRFGGLGRFGPCEIAPRSAA